MRRSALTLLLAVVALAAIAWWQRDTVGPFLAERVPVLAPYMTAAKTAGPVKAAAAAIPVVVMRAEKKTIPLVVEAVGTVQAIASIALKPRVDSQIATVEVAEGAQVKEGDLLFTLDDRTLKAQLAQADAQVARDRAQVEQARRDLARFNELLAKRISSEVQRDTAATALKVQEATLLSDQAQRENLATMVSYTQIRSPVTGRIGSIATKAGTNVRMADATSLAVINQFDPIYVVFAIPQGTFSDLQAAFAQGNITIDAKVGGATLSGKVAFVENTVDAATGTLVAKAIVPNKEERLWPGSFVAVQATLGTQADAIAVPSVAVQLGQQGAFVFVARDGKAEVRNVTVARAVGANSVIGSGLSGGEEVVIDGQLRLVAGAPVTVQPPKTDAGVAQTTPPPPRTRS